MKVQLAQVDTIPSDAPVGAEVNGLSLVLVRAGDSIKTYYGRCPHQNAMLDEGHVVDGKLVCQLHGWAYDTQSGEKIGSPSACLDAFKTTIEDGWVCIDDQEVISYQQAKGLVPVEIQRTVKSLPGPKGKPIVGNIPDIDFPVFHQQLHEWAKEYGDMYKIKMGPSGNFVIVADAEAIQIVLRDRPDTFRRIKKLEQVFTETGALGVLSAEGDTWRRHRKITAKGLNALVIKEFYPNIEEIGRRLQDRWNTAIAAGNKLPILEELLRFTVDVTTFMVMGYDINTLQNEEDTIQEQLHLIFPAYYNRINAPIPYWRLFKLPADRRLDRAFKIVYDHVDKLVDMARKRMDENPALHVAPTNFLEGMLSDTGDGMKVTEAELKGNIITLLVAGEETTAHTLSWVMYFLSQHPDMQRKLQEEVDRVLGDRFIPTYEETSSFPYMEAVIMETFRLKPVAPLSYMGTVKDTVLKGVQLPKDTPLILVHHHPGKLEEYFESADTFNPDRWMEGGSAGTHQADVITPFGGGPRFCPGRGLAYMEMKVVLSIIARSYQVSLVDDPSSVSEILAFSMMPSSFFVNFEPRVAEPVS